MNKKFKFKFKIFKKNKFKCKNLNLGSSKFTHCIFLALTRDQLRRRSSIKMLHFIFIHMKIAYNRFIDQCEYCLSRRYIEYRIVKVEQDNFLISIANHFYSFFY